MKYAKGIMWLDDCRIPFVDEKVGGGKKATTIFGGDAGYEHDGFTTNDNGGRFTPNLLVCDDMLNDGSVCGGGKNSGIVIRKRKGYKLNPNSDNLHSTSPDNYGDKGTNSRYYDLDKWFDKMIERL